MIPDTYDIISGKVRMESLASTPLVEIKHQLMPLWQKVLKRGFDILVSILFLILFSPMFLLVFFITKLSDKGPVFYLQSRIGLHAKEFKMIKFRSMTVNAEANGPQLSSEHDDRITPWGRFMRKYRLDELPQFINVIVGHMSIVGPRPERKYYMELISKKAPHYKHLHKVKPGITSWGMVKYGYAENVDEMVKRLKYDVIYIENMNLFNDLKILIYTVLIVLQGRGK
jgi:exopolysaccharide biosynthesis polyprenyl glycosylphosphotransferase